MYTKKLQHLITTVPSLLLEINDNEFQRKRLPNKWSKQEILGHLVDSATNNHQRFVRGQFEDIPVIPYNQDKWNECSHYNQFEKAQLVDFWRTYNLHILSLIQLLPKSMLQKKCNTGGTESFTIEFLFNDYVEHTEYHLNQIIPI